MGINLSTLLTWCSKHVYNHIDFWHPHDLVMQLWCHIHIIGRDLKHIISAYSSKGWGFNSSLFKSSPTAYVPHIISNIITMLITTYITQFHLLLACIRTVMLTLHKFPFMYSCAKHVSMDKFISIHLVM